MDERLINFQFLLLLSHTRPSKAGFFLVLLWCSVTGKLLSNNRKRPNEFHAVLDVLASGETVITNSYHGAYWALLMGRNAHQAGLALAPATFLSQMM